jgi:hypothetical protein
VSPTCTTVAAKTVGRHNNIGRSTIRRTEALFRGRLLVKKYPAIIKIVSRETANPSNVSGIRRKLTIPGS